MIQSAKLYKDGEELKDIVGTSVQSVYFTYTIQPNEEIVLDADDYNGVTLISIDDSEYFEL